jgi:hypothetical protein
VERITWKSMGNNGQRELWKRTKLLQRGLAGGREQEKLGQDIHVVSFTRRHWHCAYVATSLRGNQLAKTSQIKHPRALSPCKESSNVNDAKFRRAKKCNIFQW